MHESCTCGHFWNDSAVVITGLTLPILEECTGLGLKLRWRVICEIINTSTPPPPNTCVWYTKCHLMPSLEMSVCSGSETVKGQSKGQNITEAQWRADEWAEECARVHALLWVCILLTLWKSIGYVSLCNVLCQMCTRCGLSTHFQGY